MDLKERKDFYHTLELNLLGSTISGLEKKSQDSNFGVVEVALLDEGFKVESGLPDSPLKVSVMSYIHDQSALEMGMAADLLPTAVVQLKKIYNQYVPEDKQYKI